MNMVGVEAASIVIPDILRTISGQDVRVKLKIQQDNGDVHVYGDPSGIEINLKLKDNHFVNDARGVKGNDCLYYALRDNVPTLSSLKPEEFRNRLAEQIKVDPNIKSVIREGWHKNSMRRGAYGGTIDASNYPDVQKFLDGIDQDRPKLATDPPKRRNVDLSSTGGTYSNIRRKFGGSTPAGAKVALIEVNHIPPSSVYPPGHKLHNKRGKMPAMATIYEHHRDLQGTGSSAASAAYRQTLTNMIQKGDMAGALRVDLQDIRNVATTRNIAFDKKGASQIIRAHLQARTINKTQANKLVTQFKLPKI
jgi:hypothetical protein